MRDLLQRLRIVLVFAALVALTFTTMLSDRRALESGGTDHSWWSGAVMDVAAPAQKFLTWPGLMLSDTWQKYVALRDLKGENERLRTELSRLEEENLQYREALVASVYLQQIAEMRSDLEVRMLPSQVVGLDVSPWFRSVLLDRGRSHGVNAGMPVITEQGVVGLVTATSRRASKTMLLLDRQSAIDGIVQRSRVRGIVRGRESDALDFEFVVRGSDVRVGDVVVTSGLGGIYPKGLRIGEVVEVGEAGTLLQTARLQPAVDFGRLEHAFVLLWRAPTMDLLYGEGPGEDATAAAESGP
jgi:rod shape-determining protein MreC